MTRIPMTMAVASLLCSSCAELQFNPTPEPDSFTYYEPVPFAQVKVAADCTTSVDVLVMPGKPRSVRFKSGYGSANLSLQTSNGMITQLGQETDTKIPETIGAITGLATAAAGIGKGFSEGEGATKAPCKPGVVLYAIKYDPCTDRIDLDPRTSFEYYARKAQEDLKDTEQAPQ